MTNSKRKKPGKKPMTLREQAQAIARVAKLSFVTAPGAVLFKLLGAVVDALLPIATAYFAALTTTALVAAIGGDEAMRDRAILYIVITALLGLFGTAWSSVDQYIQASMRYRVESKVADRMYEHFLGLEFWRYDDKTTIDLYDKAQKFAQFFAWVFDRLASIISQLITMVASIAALTVINGWLALAVFIAIIPGVYFQFKLSRAEIAHWNDNVETRRAKNMIEWNLLQPQSATELRLYGLVKYLLTLR
ncbi:MAG TPA: ABC transporter ATP-binding protein, partial [Candidatus Saccharibacteria bacterium]|nr:ABC transporter ATP-binding protein [Candidatus Saccharibacteria bacterium]